MGSATTDRRMGLAGNTAYKTPATALASTNIVLSGEQTVGGVAVKAINAAGFPDRVLCIGQSDLTTNGLWDVSTGPWSRSVDGDGNYDWAQGSQVLIAQGSAAFQIWTLTTANPITVGSTQLLFSPSINAGNMAALAASSGSSLVGFIQSGTGAVATTQAEVNARTVNLLDYMTAAQKMDCYLRTGLIDSLPAMNACIAALTEQGTFVYPVAGRINLPKGLLYLNGTLTLAAGVHFVGHGAGQQGANWATSFKFPVNTKGILVQKANTGPNQNGGDGSILEGIFIQGSGTTTTAHGIDMQARMVLRNCAIYGFGGNGINIVADSGVRTNANNWVIENCTSLVNGGHGLYVSGADSNAGYCHMLDASNNGGWGIYDNSFLGNTYIACHTASNVAGPYQSIGANARSIFIGCYSEGGQPPSNIILTSFAMGGLHGAGFTAGSNFLTTSGNTFQTASAMTSGSFTFGYNQPLTSGTFSKFYDTTGYYTWAQNKQTGSVGYQWANLGSPGYLLWYDRNATLANGYARDLSTGTAPTGTYGAMGIDQHYAGGIHQMLWRGLGTASPTGIASLQGDIIYNTAPVSGGYIGWVCTVAGTPGTWKTFGLIS